MIVVADTTPLNYLILIDEIDVLPLIFGRVLLPLAAFQELQHPRTPLAVRQWIAHLPAWLEVRTTATITNPALMSLDPGEREAIQLALDLGISMVLMEDAEGRHVAEAFHLEVRGTLGILERGAKLGKIDLRLSLSRPVFACRPYFWPPSSDATHKKDPAYALLLPPSSSSDEERMTWRSANTVNWRCTPHQAARRCLSERLTASSILSRTATNTVMNVRCRDNIIMEFL